MESEREISNEEVNISRALAESSNDIGAKHGQNERKVRVLSCHLWCQIDVRCCVADGLVKLS